MNKWQEEDKQKLDKLLSDLNTTQDKYTFEIIKEDENNHVVLTGLIPIHVNYRDYTKRYNFSLWQHLPYVESYDSQAEFKRNYHEPQGVGVLSKSKIINWVEYLIKQYEYLVDLSEQRTAKINEFLKEIDTLDGEKNINKERTSGYITKNAIELYFEISNSGYISKRLKIRTYPVNDDLRAFKLLSNNKFTEED